MKPGTASRQRAAHPAGVSSASRLYGKRVMLRALTADDFEAFSEVRQRNGRWLTDWEPLRPASSADPAINREAFERRCDVRDRERAAGNAYTYGIFVDSIFIGEINLNGVSRGSMQSATIGYWIDRAKAGHGYVPEAVVVLVRHAFEQLRSIASRSASSRATRTACASSANSAGVMRVVPSDSWKSTACGKTTTASASPQKSGTSAPKNSRATGSSASRFLPATPRDARETTAGESTTLAGRVRTPPLRCASARGRCPSPSS